MPFLDFASLGIEVTSVPKEAKWLEGLGYFPTSSICVGQIGCLLFDRCNSELPLPCGTVVPMEVASNSRDSYPFLTKRLAVRTNQGIFTYAAIPLTGIPFGFSLWNPYTSGAERNV